MNHLRQVRDLVNGLALIGLLLVSIGCEKGPDRPVKIPKTINNGRISGTSEVKIDLSDDSLHLFPTDTKVTWLNISDNSLSELSPEIGNLKNLTWLNVSDNSIRYLPDEIGNLSQLKELDLSENKLMRLDPEFGQLSSLERLNLSSNWLKTLPPEFGMLENLRDLNLDSNSIAA